MELFRVGFVGKALVRKGKIRRSNILMAEHKREIGQCDLLSLGFLCGFKMGTMKACFHMAGMVAVFTKLLKI